MNLIIQSNWLPPLFSIPYELSLQLTQWWASSGKVKTSFFTCEWRERANIKRISENVRWFFFAIFSPLLWSFPLLIYSLSSSSSRPFLCIHQIIVDGWRYRSMERHRWFLYVRWSSSVQRCDVWSSEKGILKTRYQVVEVWAYDSSNFFCVRQHNRASSPFFSRMYLRHFKRGERCAQCKRKSVSRWHRRRTHTFWQMIILFLKLHTIFLSCSNIFHTRLFFFFCSLSTFMTLCYGGLSSVFS